MWKNFNLNAKMQFWNITDRQYPKCRQWWWWIHNNPLCPSYWCPTTPVINLVFSVRHMLSPYLHNWGMYWRQFPDDTTIQFMPRPNPCTCVASTFKWQMSIQSCYMLCIWRYSLPIGKSSQVSPYKQTRTPQNPTNPYMQFLTDKNLYPASNIVKSSTTFDLGNINFMIITFITYFINKTPLPCIKPNQVIN